MKRIFEKWISFFLLLAIFVTGVPVSVSAAVADIVADTLNDSGSVPLWEYTETEGGIVLTKYNGTATDVYIPSAFDDKTVVALADSLFENNDALNSATLGAGILEIGAKAFYDCDNLVCVLVSEELTTVGDMAFYGCDVFNSIILYEAAVNLGADIFAECPKVVVWCYTDSAAHTYAIDHDLTHNFMDSEAEPETVEQGGLEYYVLNGQAYVVGVTDATLTSFVIPAYIEGCPVTEIRAGVFKGNATVTDVALPNTLKLIADNAFYGCSALVTADIPNSVETIGASAFYNCSSLKKVAFSDTIKSIGSKSFYGCSALETVTIPGNLNMWLGDYTFYNCTGLVSVVIEDGVKRLTDGMFTGCSSLVSVDLPDSMEWIRTACFSGCSSLREIDIPEGITHIMAQTFSGCSSLTSLTIPKSVYSIESYAFYGCSNLQEIVFEGNITSFHSAGTFLACYALEKIVFSESQETIPAQVGGGSTSLRNLKEVVIGKNVKTIENAFTHAYKVYTAVIPESVTQMVSTSFAPNTVLQVYEGSYAHEFAVENGFLYALYDGSNALELVELDGVTYYVTDTEAIAIGYDGSETEVTLPETVDGKPLTELRATFYNCTELTAVSIPDSVKRIGAYTFYNCSNLKTATLPSGIEVFEDYAFYNCSNLVFGDIFGHATAIGAYAFRGCYRLSQITIPGSVESIGNYAFQNAFLKTLTIEEGVKHIGDSAFTSNSIKSLSIPSSVESIGRSAFSYCEGLTEVSFADGITELGENVFSGCRALKTVSFPKSLGELTGNWFNNCTLITNITIPEGITTIGSGMFSDSAKITKVIIPQSVTTMYTDSFAINTLLLVYENSYAHQFAEENSLLYALYDGVNEPEVAVIDGVTYAVLENEAIAIGCDGSVKELVMPDTVNGRPVTELRGTFYKVSVDSITLPSTLKVIGENAFASCFVDTTVVIPEGVTTIAEYAFQSCHLTGVVIPASITNFGSYAFDGCKYLKNITLTEGLRVMGEYAFSNCTALSSVSIPGSLTEIPTGAFSDCTKLAVLTVGEGVETIKPSAFDTCTALVNVDLPESVKTVDGFQNCRGLVSITMPGAEIVGGFLRCTSLVDVVLPVTAVELSESAFQECTSLKTFTAPGLKIIGAGAFVGCSALESAVFSGNLTAIGNKAFSRCSALRFLDLSGTYDILPNYVCSMCTSLSEVVLPSSLTEIEICAFEGCSSLSAVVIPETVKFIHAGAFSRCTSLKNVNLPDSVETIESGAFSGCSNLRFVYVPETIVSMSDATHTTNPSFPATTVLVVHENSYAHKYAVNNKLLYFVLGTTENPEISYGMGMEGVVTYDDGTAASGVTVEIFYDDGTLKESVVTDANGAYAFTYAEVGRYTVRATDADGNTAVTQASVKRINVFDVFLAGDTDLVLKKGWTVSGTLSENTATVTLTDGDGNVIATAETTDGTFTLEKIPNGTYVLKAESESASTAQEITVFDGDVSDLSLTFPTETASIAGSVAVEKRDKKHEKRGWVQVTLYNSEGVAVDTCKSDSDGNYFFPHLPLDEYTIVAETAEMREDKKHHFDISHTLTGYAYVNVTEATTYTVDVIVLYEENDNRATISGKVTANGQTQVSEVILRNCFRHEVARMSTGSNGKYTFSNVKDGLYIVTAVTESDGMGFAVVLVRGGKVHGETDIRIFKSDKIKDREGKFKDHVPDCKDRDEAKKYRDWIAEEKRFYDGLSEKEKRQCSKEYVERLNRYCEWIAEVDYSTNDDSVKVEKGGLVVSGDELAKESNISFNLIVNKTNGHEASKDGVHNKEDHLYHDMHDKAGKHEIRQYYDISMTKTVDGEEIELESVYKNTDSSGKFRITITIPEEYRGHKHYTILHEHCGEVVTLTDLDDDPDTITFEVDKFSTFALAATDEVLVGEDLGTELNFAGASLTLQEDLTINYKVDETLFTTGGFASPYVVFVMNGVETVVTEYTVESGYYVFRFAGILPSQMNDGIEATLCATKDGVLYQGASKTYSVATYCYNMLANHSDDEELRALLVDILNYGAATQVYTDYNTDALANAGLTDAQKAWASADRAFVSVEDHEYETIYGSSVTWIGAGLSLSESIAVRFEFTAESTEGMLAEITCGDTTWTVSDFATSADGNDMFLARINAAYMSEPIYVKLYRDGAVISDTVCYSIESYAKTFEADEKLANLVKAMMKYGDSARNYVTE